MPQSLKINLQFWNRKDCHLGTYIFAWQAKYVFHVEDSNLESNIVISISPTGLYNMLEAVIGDNDAL